MKVFFTMALIWLAASMQAQSSAAITLGGLAARHGTADNITVGDTSVWAAYPDAEFILSRRDMKLRVTVIDDLGDERDQTLTAVVSQVSEGMFRADVDENTWVQIDANEGVTCVYQNCVARVYRPICR